MLIVTTAAESPDLTTLDYVRRRLRVTTEADDDELATLITEKSADAATWCNRVLVQETVSETIRFRSVEASFCDFDVVTERHPSWTAPPYPIQLQRYPLASVTSVTVDGTALTASDYEHADDVAQLWRIDATGCRIGWSGLTVVVVYVAGYVTDAGDPMTVPPDLQGAIVEMVKMDFAADTRDPAIKSETIDGIGSTDYWVGGIPGDSEDGLPPQIARRLRPYRAPAV